MQFSLKVGGVYSSFTLPVNQAGVAKVISRGARPSKTQIVRAEWIAWRILKNWIEAQIALVESSQAEMGQVFMPYATQQDGRTLYQLFVESNQKQLGSGDAA